VRDTVTDVEAAGETAVVVTIDDEAAAVLTVSDELRAGASDAMAALTRITGVRPVMLTGDNRRAAARIARLAGVGEVYSELLPDEKLSHIHALRSRGHVTVVGDGVNDAPMLAAAGTGIAMGTTGADIALDTADVVLVRDDLIAVPSLVALSRRARRVVVQNLTFAFAVIIGLVGWDLVGHLPLPLGVAGHEMSTVLVGLNGLRLLSARAWSIEPG
jgi:P-type E1-E2 ATPase